MIQQVENVSQIEVLHVFMDQLEIKVVLSPDLIPVTLLFVGL